MEIEIRSNRGGMDAKKDMLRLMEAAFGAAIEREGIGNRGEFELEVQEFYALDVPRRAEKWMALCREALDGSSEELAQALCSQCLHDRKQDEPLVFAGNVVRMGSYELRMAQGDYRVSYKFIAPDLRDLDVYLSLV